MFRNGTAAADWPWRARLGQGLLLIGLLLWMAALVLPRHLVGYGLVAALLGALIHGNFSISKDERRQLLMRLALPVAVLFALLWSSDVPQGLRDVGAIMSLVAAAVLAQLTRLQPRDVQLLLRAFVLVAVGALVWMLFHGLGIYALTGLRSHLSYHPLAMSLGRTAPYAGYLLASALLILAFVPLWRPAVRVGLAILLLVGLWMLAVKAVLLACLLITGAGLGARWALQRVSIRRMLVAVALAGALLALMLSIAPARERMFSALDTDWRLLQRQDFAREDVYLPELPLRVLLWRESLAATEGQWLQGLGTGAQTRSLRARLDALRLHPRLLDLNSHNLYLHLYMAQGLMGLGALLLLVVGWGRGAPPVLLAVMSFFGVVGLTEVWLFRHDGAMLFALLLILLSPTSAGRADAAPAPGIPSDTPHTAG